LESELIDHHLVNRDGAHTCRRLGRAEARRHCVEPSLLTVEVTESALLVDFADAADKLTSLRALGTRVAPDDFGSGYTSLAYLRQLPIDVIKIDRSFIADPQANAFIKLIIDTGHLIGASITAEGIETEAQVSMLASSGCDSFQGFYLGRPGPDPQVSFGIASSAGSPSRSTTFLS